MKPTPKIETLPLVLLAALLAITTGCDRFFESGSVYKTTGRIGDLLAEPMLDIAEATLAVKYPVSVYDVDGHGWFDTPIVAAEFILTLPNQIIDLPYQSDRLCNLIADPGWGMSRHDSFAKKVRDNGLLLFGFLYTPFVAIPSGAVTWTGIWFFDIAVHDLPVITIGKPVALLRNWIRTRTSQ